MHVCLRQALVTNIGSMFEENYNLAFTQQRKNKDIPEGGSKGVILLNLAHQVLIICRISVDWEVCRVNIFPCMQQL